MKAARRMLGVLILVGLVGVPAFAEEAGESAADEAAKQQVNLERLELVQQIQGFIAFGRNLGFTPRDLLAITKVREQKKDLQDALRQEAAVLSAALDSAISAPEATRAAAERYVKVREKTLAEMTAADQELIKQVGADQDPAKLAGLMIMGVVDNGVRLLCGIHNGVIGGAPTGTDAAAGLRPTAPPATQPSASRPKPSAP